MDHQAFARKFAFQLGCCAICKAEGPLVIDHDHSSGAVRGLLCQQCNSGLGFFRDNIDTLKQAIAYLESRSQAERRRRLKAATQTSDTVVP
jgi:hypothetical protein